jgi:ParB family transcriptional regulator, chromosome partitioning protein
VSMGLSVRQTEGFVRSQSNTRPPKADGQLPVSQKDPNVAALEQELSLLLGLRVALQTNGTDAGGVLSIHYSTLDQLDVVLAKLRANN